jgi:hypothetical protein
MVAALRTLPSKPAADAAPGVKNAYAQRVSAAIALALADELRERGMSEARPAGPGDLDSGSGAERRLAGAFGSKTVDVSWATEDSGLLFSATLKSINFRDGKSGNFQKNLTNRRGDMLIEALSLHRRFPYAVLSGWIILDKDAATDDTNRRRSTFDNAFPRLRLFTGRNDPTGREEQFERLYVLLLDANPFAPSLTCWEADDSTTPVPLDRALTDLLGLVAERNFDTYEQDDQGRLSRV